MKRVGNKNMYIIGDRVLSYGTCIKDVLPDGRIIVNATKYSATTTRHQSIEARMRNYKPADVVVTNVPIGTKYLAAWYLQQPKQEE